MSTLGLAFTVFGAVALVSCLLLLLIGHRLAQRPKQRIVRHYGERRRLGE